MKLEAWHCTLSLTETTFCNNTSCLIFWDVKKTQFAHELIHQALITFEKSYHKKERTYLSVRFAHSFGTRARSAWQLFIRLGLHGKINKISPLEDEIFSNRRKNGQKYGMTLLVCSLARCNDHSMLLQCAVLASFYRFARQSWFHPEPEGKRQTRKKKTNTLRFYTVFAHSRPPRMGRSCPCPGPGSIKRELGENCPAFSLHILFFPLILNSNEK